MSVLDVICTSPAHEISGFSQPLTLLDPVFCKPHLPKAFSVHFSTSETEANSSSTPMWYNFTLGQCMPLLKVAPPCLNKLSCS